MPTPPKSARPWRVVQKSVAIVAPRDRVLDRGFATQEAAERRAEWRRNRYGQARIVVERRSEAS